jgi:hypothetical protein
MTQSWKIEDAKMLCEVLKKLNACPKTTSESEIHYRMIEHTPAIYQIHVTKMKPLFHAEKEQLVVELSPYIRSLKTHHTQIAVDADLVQNAYNTLKQVTTPARPLKRGRGEDEDEDLQSLEVTEEDSEEENQAASKRQKQHVDKFKRVSTLQRVQTHKSPKEIRYACLTLECSSRLPPDQLLYQTICFQANRRVRYGMDTLRHLNHSDLMHLFRPHPTLAKDPYFQSTTPRPSPPAPVERKEIPAPTTDEDDTEEETETEVGFFGRLKNRMREILNAETEYMDAMSNDQGSDDEVLIPANKRLLNLVEIGALMTGAAKTVAPAQVAPMSTSTYTVQELRMPSTTEKPSSTIQGTTPIVSPDTVALEDRYMLLSISQSIYNLQGANTPSSVQVYVQRVVTESNVYLMAASGFHTLDLDHIRILLDMYPTALQDVWEDFETKKIYFRIAGAHAEPAYCWRNNGLKTVDLREWTKRYRSDVPPILHPDLTTPLHLVSSASATDEPILAMPLSAMSNGKHHVSTATKNITHNNADLRTSSLFRRG